jgi:CheY-like chemotaxis protein
MSDQAGFLLVEDNEDDILLVQRAFRQAKIVNPLMVVKSAEEGMSYFRGQGRYANRSEFPLPSLVLLDLKLPGLGGFEFLKWIRAQPDVGRTRVVVLTSSNLMQDVNRAHDLGANSFLVKPIGFETFVQTCRALSGYWLWMDLPPEVQRVAVESPPLADTNDVQVSGKPAT